MVAKKDTLDLTDYSAYLPEVDMSSDCGQDFTVLSTGTYLKIVGTSGAYNLYKTTDFITWTLLASYTYYQMMLHKDSMGYTNNVGGNFYDLIIKDTVDDGATWTLVIQRTSMGLGAHKLIVFDAETLHLILAWTTAIIGFYKVTPFATLQNSFSLDLTPTLMTDPTDQYLASNRILLVIDSSNSRIALIEWYAENMVSKFINFTEFSIANLEFKDYMGTYKFQRSSGAYLYNLFVNVYNTSTSKYYIGAFTIDTLDYVNNAATTYSFRTIQEGFIVMPRFFDSTDFMICVDAVKEKIGYMNPRGLFYPMVDLPITDMTTITLCSDIEKGLVLVDGDGWYVESTKETLALTQCSTHYSVNKAPTLAVMGTYVPTKDVAWILYDNTTLIYMGMLVNWKHDGTQYTYDVISYEELDRQVEITETFTTQKPSEIFEYSVFKYGRFLYPGTVDVGATNYSPSFKRKSLEHLFDWCDNGQADLIFIEPDGKANFTDTLVVRDPIIEADGGFMQFQYSSEPKSLQNLELKGKFDATLGKPVEVVRENQLGGSWYRDWLPEMDETDLIAFADELEAKKNTDLVSIQITRPVSVITTFYQIGDRAAVTSTRYGMAADVCYVIETDNDYISRLSGAVLNNALYVEMNKDMKEKEGMKNDVKKLGYEVEDMQVKVATLETLTFIPLRLYGNNWVVSGGAYSAAKLDGSSTHYATANGRVPKSIDVTQTLYIVITYFWEANEGTNRDLKIYAETLAQGETRGAWNIANNQTITFTAANGSVIKRVTWTITASTLAIDDIVNVILLRNSVAGQHLNIVDINITN